MSFIRMIAIRIRSVLGRVFPRFYEEVEVARYVVIAESAGGFTIPDPASELGLSDRHIQDIDAPGRINTSRPVIFFRTTPTGKPSFSVRLNSTPLTQHTFSTAGPRSWQEIIPAKTLKLEDNELTFAVSGTGSVRFSDVVILYTSNQLTVQKPFPDPVISQS